MIPSSTNPCADLKPNDTCKHPSDQGSNSSSGSDSCESEHSTAMKKSYRKDEQHSATEQPLKMRALPIFDMRKAEKMVAPKFANLNVGSVLTEEGLRTEISEHYNAPFRNIHIKEEKGTKEETLWKTFIFITQEHPAEICHNMVVEIYDFFDKVGPELKCVRVAKRTSMLELSKVLMKELNWRGIKVCKRQQVLGIERTMDDYGFEDFDRIQVIQTHIKSMKFTHLPRLGVEIAYTLEIDIVTSIESVIRKLVNEFKTEILVHKTTPEQTVRLSFRDTLLDNNACIGMILFGCKEEHFRIHLTNSNDIGIYLKYKEIRVKRRDSTYKTKHIFIQHDSSTADLRTEVARYLQVDPRAVKLTVGGKRIDEHDNLQAADMLTSGCTVVAGIKKRKTLRVRHPDNETEVAVESFMLEPVRALKEVLAEKLNINILHMSLKCRQIKMKDNMLLLDYPLKNNMVLSLHLYKHRLLLRVSIHSKKAKINIVVDDDSKTTVDDLLRYCAQRCRYRRDCSRAICQQRCLNKFLTLGQEGLESGDSLLIVNFENSYRLRGDLVRIFTASTDGQIKDGYGTISAGLLLYAPTNVQWQPREDEDLDLNNGAEPSGIHVMDEPRTEPVASVARHLTKDASTMTNRGENDPTKGRIKAEFLSRARKICKRRFDTAQKSPIDRNVHEPSVATRNRQDTEKPTFYLAHETEDSVDPELKTNVDRTYYQCKDCNVESDCGQEETDRIKNIQCIERCWQQIKHVHIGTVSSKKKRESNSSTPSTPRDVEGEIKKTFPEKTVKRKLLFFCNDINERTINPTTQQRSVNDLGVSLLEESDNTSPTDEGTQVKSYASLESVDDSPTTNISEQDVRGSRLVELFHGRNHRSFESYSNLPSHHLAHNPRSSVYTERDDGVEGDMIVPYHSTHNHYMLFKQESNADLSTAGITIPLLEYVSEQIGRHWAKLARRLEVPETEITAIEHDYKFLYEAGYQALVSWKRRNGLGATKAVLMQALKGMGMISIAESCERMDYRSGYLTA